MQLTEITYRDAVPIDGYGPGFFRVAGQVLEGPIVVTAQAARSWGGLTDGAAVVALADPIDVIFLGMGAEIAHAPAELRSMVEATGIGLEVMATPAACRTYNVLVNDGRRVALAVIPI